MKHFEPGEPYHRPKKPQGEQVRRMYVGATAVRRARARRMRLLMAVLLLIAAVLIGLAVSLTHSHRDTGAESPAASQSSSVALETPAPTETPTPTETPQPTETPEPTPEEPAFVPLWDTTGREGFPYLLTVNRQQNTVTVYEKDGEGNYTVPFKAMICSTGRDTPEGTFRTSDQYTWRALVGGVYGQYATRITTDILFHSVPYFSQNKNDLEYEEYNKLGTAASLGCVRMKVEDCKWIYEECPAGTTVVLYDDDNPGPLGKPEFTPMDLENQNRGWDPTDPDPANPWLTVG